MLFHNPLRSIILFSSMNLGLVVPPETSDTECVSISVGGLSLSIISGKSSSSLSTLLLLCVEESFVVGPSSRKEGS